MTDRPVSAAGQGKPGTGQAPQILLIPGSTRAAATNVAVLRTVAQIASDGVVAVLYERLAELPAFNPDHDGETAGAAVADLRRQLAAADAVLFCTPEYAGTLPGSFKNLLDWTVGSGDLYGKPVAWVNVANAGRGEGAQAALAMVLRYVGAVSQDGLIDDPAIRELMAGSLRHVVRHVRAQQAPSGTLA
jgi:chromate reductase